MNVVVTGSLAYDYIMNFPGRFADRIMPDKIHKLSLSFLVNKLNKNFGGTAGNIAYTLKLLGVEPLILSAAGNDFAPYAAHLNLFNISKRFIKIHKNVSTGSYFGITDQQDNQIGAFYEGALKYTKQLSLRIPSQSLLQEDLLQKASLCVISPTNPQAMKRYVKECQKLKLPYLYDPAFQIDHFTPEELRQGITGAQILIGNDYEIALIEKKLHFSHRELVQLVPIVVTTLGAKGSVIESVHQSFWGRAKRGLQNPDSGLARMTKKISLNIKAARSENTSDPTGAGDTYRAGFLAGFLHGFDLQICGQMGAVAAVYSVEKYGTQTHYFTKNDFGQRYKENFGQALSL